MLDELLDVAVGGFDSALKISFLSWLGRGSSEQKFLTFVPNLKAAES